jgi:hypothetical protein
MYALTCGHAEVVVPGVYTYRVYVKAAASPGDAVYIDEPGWLRLLVFRSPMLGDFDNDGDVDLGDYGEFAEAFTGPNP